MHAAPPTLLPSPLLVNFPPPHSCQGRMSRVGVFADDDESGDDGLPDYEEVEEAADGAGADGGGDDGGDDGDGGANSGGDVADMDAA